MPLNERFTLPDELKHLTSAPPEVARSGAQTEPRIFWRAFRFASIVFCTAAVFMLAPSLGTIGTGGGLFGGPPSADSASRISGVVRVPSSGIPEQIARVSRPSTHSEAEALLFDTVAFLRAGYLGRAEQSIERLLERYPNYQLAHLIRADILQARAGKLSRIGSGAGEAKSIDGLLRELEARLSKFKEPAIEGRRPDMFVQLAPQVKHAFAVDVSRARLYVLENTAMGPKRVLDVYATIGLSGSGKLREGDKRTPIGVYTLKAALDRSKLTDFYGDGAYPLDYPNVLDKRAGRDGYGIWIHGVAKENFVRPPQSSDGCIVVSNADLKLLTRYINPGETPIAIAEAINWIPAAQVSPGELALRQSLESWRADWESRDHERYLGNYAEQFFSENVKNLAQWSERRRQFTEQKKSVQVKLDNLSIAQIPNSPDTMMVSFEQVYRGDAVENTLRKKQYWQREGNRWKIIYEGNV